MTIQFLELYEKTLLTMQNLSTSILHYMPRVRAESRSKIMASFVAAEQEQIIGVWKMGPSGPIEIDFAVAGTQAYEELLAVTQRWPDSRFS